MTTKTEPQELALDELRGLYELVRSLHSAQGLEGIVTAFLEKLNDVVPFDTCAVILGDGNCSEFEITHAAGEHGASLVGRKITPGEGISGWVVANRHPFCNTDPRLDLPSTLVDKFEHYRTLAVFPILKGNELFGAVALYSSSTAKYDATQQRLLSEASGLLALALSAVVTAVAVPPVVSDDIVPQRRVDVSHSFPSRAYNKPMTFPLHLQASDRAH